jgi:imidazolonepropionase-like amidohydrolase
VHLAWHDENTLIWSIASRFFTQKLEEETPRVVEVPLTVPRAKPAGKIAFQGARIITMRGDEVIPAGTLLVEGNRIAAVGPADQVPLPRDALVVDARGTTIIPGLIDSHAHMHGDREFPPELKWEYVVLLAHGVTTTLDPQAPTADVFALSDLVEAGEMIGPRIYSTGRGITGAEPATPFMYFGINSLEDARRVVRAYHAFRPLMLKDYVHARREQRQWLARAAREHDIRLTAEGSGDWLLDLTIVLDGYTAFEHDLPIRLYNDVAQFMARAGAYYTPTLIGTYGGKGAKQYFQLATAIYDDPKLRRFTPASQLQGSLTVARAPEYDWFFKSSAESAAKILRAGGHVTVGGHGDQQGIGTLWETWGIAMGGLTPLETIRVATLEGADKLGLRQDLGSLEAGKLADFLVLDANPLDDIHHLARQRYVVKNGFVYDSESMSQVWPTYKPLPKFFWMSDAERAWFKAPTPEPLAARGTVARRAHPAVSRVASPRPAIRGQ